MSKKIAMIGAGSIVFCKRLMSDFMATPALADSEFALMSRTEPRLRRMEAFGKKMLKENGLGGSVWATLDRREALKDAGFVVVMIQVGAVDVEADTGDVQRDVGGPAAVAAAVRNKQDRANADHKYSQRLQSGPGAAGPGAGYRQKIQHTD